MTLAIHGGKPIRNKLFPGYQVIGPEERRAVLKVIDSGILSKFIGGWTEDFFGGPEIQSMEKAWADFFNVKHAISVNSCTSGLYCAVGALGIEPGQEIIVSPYTMSASAVAPLIYNALPVFADIEEDFFCLDPASVSKRITKNTKAILIVDIFGQPFDREEIIKIAREHKLYIIEDAAQAAGAIYKKKFAGTLADIGVFSLNYHKHIHCGEGGVVVTNNDALADKIRLIRNHAESVVGDKGNKALSNMIGFNYRLTEIQAAIARVQLKKLPFLTKQRQERARYLSKKLNELPFLSVPQIRSHCTHAFYVFACKYNERVTGIPRAIFIEAVKAELAPMRIREKEGPLIFQGYVKPLYLLPLFQKRIAYGKRGYPFSLSRIRYPKGLCPVTERMHEKELFTLEYVHPFMSKRDLDDIVNAFYKVWEHRKELIAKKCPKNAF